MKIEFRTNKLRKCYENFRYCERALGELARIYVRRINEISACSSVEDLHRLPPLRFHPLKGEREGQWAISLGGQMRLVVTLRDKSGETTVRIEEVSKHYD